MSMRGVLNYPFWPPTSPQRPAVIAGRQSLRVREDLRVNQIPHGDLNEVYQMQRPYPKPRKTEQPTAPETRHIGQTGSTLFDLFLQSQFQAGASSAWPGEGEAQGGSNQ